MYTAYVAGGIRIIGLLNFSKSSARPCINPQERTRRGGAVQGAPQVRRPRTKAAAAPSRIQSRDTRIIENYRGVAVPNLSPVQRTRSCCRESVGCEAETARPWHSPRAAGTKLEARRAGGGEPPAPSTRGPAARFHGKRGSAPRVAGP
eukprot:SAG31_NODE_4915_length_2870_cov_8.711913_3_plen_147_part_01